MTGTSEGSKKGWSKKRRVAFSEYMKKGFWSKKRRAAQSNRMKGFWEDSKYQKKFEKYPRDKYPREVRHFIAMQERVSVGYSTTVWPRTRKGFFQFLKYIGKIPEDMKKPSVGRKNHKKGYQPGNCAWQERSENSAEVWTRPGAKEKQSIRSKDICEKRWSDPNERISHGRKVKDAWERGSYADR